MWHGNKIYFLSDRDDQQAHEPLRLRPGRPRRRGSSPRSRTSTSSSPRSATRPSSSRTAATSTASTWPPRRPRRCRSASSKIAPAAAAACVRTSARTSTDFEISPDGKRALFGARGDIFTVPAKHGPTRNLTNTSGVHERNSEVVARRQDRSPSSPTPPARTKSTSSPQDGKRRRPAAHHRRRHLQVRASPGRPTARRSSGPTRSMRLQFVDVATKTGHAGRPQAKAWEIRDYVWSPDSKWIAYSQPEADGMTKVYLYSLEQDKTFAVTDGWYDSVAPDVQRRRQVPVLRLRARFQPDLQPDRVQPRLPGHGAHLLRDAGQGHAVALQARRATRSTRPTTSQARQGGEAKKRHRSRSTPTASRTASSQLPVSAGQLPQPRLGRQHRLLPAPRQQGRSSRCFQMFDLGRQQGNRPRQRSTATRSPPTARRCSSRQDGKYGIIDLPKGPVTIGEPLNLSGMEMKLDRQQEWKQIFNECWRQMRDFFYDPNMHGVDWKAMRDEVRAAASPTSTIAPTSPTSSAR